jgi:acetyltransferase-like isoleucine patch superfamily enzyme
MNIHNILLQFIEKYKFIFSWVNFFYPKSKELPIAYKLYYFFPQKILRINGKIPWPVHFTSRILYYERMKTGKLCAPGMSSGCYIQARNGINLGNNIFLGPNVGLISSGHELDDYYIYTHNNPISIGDNVWIGMNSVVLPGITIGNNVVIGAGSVVTKDIPSNSIAVGNPCKVIKNKNAYKGTINENKSLHF